jgi:hypothetical protein
MWQDAAKSTKGSFLEQGGCGERPKERYSEPQWGWPQFTFAV